MGRHGLNTHWVKSIREKMRENTEQKNSEYGHFARSDLEEVNHTLINLTLVADIYTWQNVDIRYEESHIVHVTQI